MDDGDSSFPAVELCGVSKRFGSRVILDGIDLTVARGEVLVLVGPSGSGKSTLLKIISGIETPDSGRVRLGGRDCTDVPPYRRAVHTVFQNYALFPHLDVTGNVAFPLSVAGMPRADREKRVAEALGWVKLSQHAQRRVTSLSGGERQRVALARALVDSPDCVLLDEPLSALDPHLRAQTLELLEEIQVRLRTTFVFITHDRQEALRLGHRIGVLNHGRLEQLGAPEELYARPRTAFVASFLGKMNWMRGELVNAGGGRTLAIAGQIVAGARGEGLSAGRVKVGVRPEGVCIERDGCLRGEVVGRQFLGDSVIVQLKLEDGQILFANQRGAGDAEIGQQVRIHWKPEAIHLFPPDEKEAAQ